MNDADDKFLRIKAVIDKTGRSRAAIYRMMAEGRFPLQERIGVRAVGWRLSAILRWMASPSEFGDASNRVNGKRE
ncbi:AlpA family phage regulatory protein [Sphingomonas sp. NIBR02145]|uniref:helix-turn-helix transcriptional regulator n=1 Tax=Sphingomonas sp. NIBR02145 TaxID=3014784 RepID=UPI0022B340B1|nr:AlpA family phage regulatory protein [Sphingomonas sp. NIBR02145]WHU04257.1 AlpA family phage regulatory protein [Sphingomonas sp. NIBR02145]